MTSKIRRTFIAVMTACTAAVAGEAPRINGPTIYGVRPDSPII
jgi:hypothetical protein